MSIPPQCTRCGKDYLLAMDADQLNEEPRDVVDSDPMVTTAHESDGVVFFHA